MPPQLPKGQRTLGHSLQLQREPQNTPSKALSSTVDLSDLDSQQFEEHEAATSTPISTRPTLIPALDHTKIKKKRSSWIYKHMRDTNDPETVFWNRKGKKEWRCRYYLQDYQLSGGTDNIKGHLNWHDIFEDSPKEKRAKNMTLNIEDAIASAVENPQKRRKLNKEEATTDFNPDVAEILYIKFIAVCNQPLRLVECPEFRTFLFYLNKDIESWLPDDNYIIYE